MAVDMSRISAGSLHKGGMISAREISKACGEVIGTTGFRLGAMAVKAALETHFDNKVTIRFIGNELRILTDREAVHYNQRSFNAGLRKAKRANRRAQAIDSSALEPADLSQHNANLQEQAVILTFVRKRRTLKLLPTECPTPELADV